MQRRKLEEHGLDDLADAVVISNEVGVRKPNPQIFETAKERLPAESYLYVGDTFEEDIAPAREGGFETVYIGDDRPDAPVSARRTAALASLLLPGRRGNRKLIETRRSAEVAIRGGWSTHSTFVDTAIPEPTGRIAVSTASSSERTVPTYSPIPRVSPSTSDLWSGAPSSKCATRSPKSIGPLVMLSATITPPVRTFGTAAVGVGVSAF